MEKYNGNQKAFIYVSCDEKQRQEAFDKYLEPLAKEGISFWWADDFDKKEEKTLARSKAVLLFLTKDYSKDKRLRDTLTAAVQYNKPVLCVYLEEVELDAALSMQTEAQQALFVHRYKSDEEMVKELKEAAIFRDSGASAQQEGAKKKRSLAAVAAAVIVLIAAIVIIKPLLAPKANAETMAALGLKGLSKEELESIEELHIVGTDVVNYHVSSAHYDNGDTSRIIYENEYGEGMTATAGTITDLSGLDQLKNLRVLQIEGQQIEDITPLLKLEKLEELSISCNPVSSVDGLEQLGNLYRLDIACTNISELPEGMHLGSIDAEDAALTKMPDFGGVSDVNFRANRNDFTDVSNLSTAESYDFLQFEANGNDAEIIRLLSGKPVKSFLVAGMQIDSLEDLADLDVSEELNIAWCTLTSLDGIEHFEGITKLDLKYATGLTDLTPINRLRSIRMVTLSDELAGMADQIDDRIEVIFRND